MTQILTLASGILLAVLLLLLSHWFPWVQKLPRLRAYSCGTICIWFGFALWRILDGDYWTPLGLGAIVVLGGAAVILAYQIDEWVLAIRQARKAERNDPEL